MENKGTVLILMADIASHCIPTFFLSRRLGSAGYKIVYAGNSEEVKNIVTDSGFSYEAIVPWDNLNLPNKALTFNKFIRHLLRDDIYRIRKKRIHEIIIQHKITFVLIDIFSSNDFFIVSQLAEKPNVYFLSPMLSTYKIHGFPTIKDYNWGHKRKFSFKSRSIGYFRIKYLLISQSIAIINWFKILDRSIRCGLLIGKIRVSFNKSHVLTFKGVEEFLLAPKELELSSKIIKNHQKYLGLCIDIERNTYNYNINIQNLLQEAQQLKNISKKVIYVSFGTYFSSADEYRRISEFILALIEVANNDENLVFIIATNKKLVGVLKGYIRSENCFLLDKVPQLKFLEVADVFISHGGLSSIKESIYYKVPLLVYPLDFNWDQCGNSLKICHHGIGLRGEIDKDEPSQIYEKIKRLLYDVEFKQAIVEFSNKIDKEYGESFIENFIDRFFDSKVAIKQKSLF